ncbi:MAG: enoyl-CoA hydratase/isomerase family protein, partial [Candidatus Eremiobacteraeota bacterium]|nr:enoyl-CoA hydratase/isomerase family protein [Candidatus Eremiobacteraeota bacterium]
MIETVAFDDNDVAGFFDRLESAIASERSRAILIAVSTRDELGDASLRESIAQADPRALFDSTMRRQKILRALETCGKPVSAAIEGFALGVGMEVALAAHYRVAAEGARCGLTQVSFGLIPGNGGTQRFSRLAGFAKGVPPLLESKRLRAAELRELGVVDELAAPGESAAAASAWLHQHAAAAQRWDAKGYALPGGSVQGRAGTPFFMAASAMLRERTYGNYPAAVNTLSCVYEGLQVDFDTALKIESRYFVQTALAPQARNMLRLMRGIGDANRLENRPAGIASKPFAKVGVLGAGMMGAAIAYATARAGIAVALIDTTQELADAGKAYGRDERAGALIEASTDFAALAGSDLVVEAVFEDRAIKADVTKRAENTIAPDAVFASNTSTLPISSLAEASARP